MVKPKWIEDYFIIATVTNAGWQPFALVFSYVIYIYLYIVIVTNIQL